MQVISNYFLTYSGTFFEKFMETNIVFRNNLSDILKKVMKNNSNDPYNKHINTSYFKAYFEDYNI